MRLLVIPYETTSVFFLGARHNELNIQYGCDDFTAYAKSNEERYELIAKDILRKNQKIVLGINQADLLFKDNEHLDGVDLTTIEDTDPILVGKVEDLYENVFADIFNDFENVIKTTVFMTDLSQFATFNGIYAQYFPSNPPARSCVEVSALPKGALVECEVIAKK